MAGKPCIRGMRITPFDVLDYLASGMTYEEMVDDFPYLTKDDIVAALSYIRDQVNPGASNFPTGECQ